MSLFSERRVGVLSYFGIGLTLMTMLSGEPTPLLIALFVFGALLALVPAIYAYAQRNHAMSKDEKKPDGINISSVNQSGGFTGIQNIHNHGKPQRRSTESDLAQIASHLAPGSVVDVQFMQGDGDGATLAAQIGDYLTSKGFKPEVGALITNVPVRGVTLFLKNDPPCIQIGYPD